MNCLQLSEAFYAHVERDPLLRPIFPRTFRCAIHGLAAFLEQVTAGPPEKSARVYVSLRDGHRKLRLGPAEREAWLACMAKALDDAQVEEPERSALWSMFEQAAAYLTGKPHREVPEMPGWQEQLTLDKAVDALRAGETERVLELLRGVRPKHHGRTMLHMAAGAGNLAVVEYLLDQGYDPTVGLGAVANECRVGGGEIVRAFVRAGGDVNARHGANQCTPLHMAARRGNVEIARTLLEYGADPKARDRKRDTPLQRAINCRKPAVAALLRAKPLPDGRGSGELASPIAAATDKR
jgi:hemoglobin